ncbi:MAG: hypothetical protein J1E02_09315, partial [Coprobacter sp.]|nr:hypothetical protein [Coprobacter sp.]
MKTRKKLCAIFVVMTSMLLSGCLKNNGNMLSSYGTGTVKQTDAGTKYIQFDNTYLCIKSNQIGESVRPGERVFTAFTIDWDAQTDAANQEGIYEASLESTSYFPVEECTAFSEANNAAFAGSDSLVNLSQPFITYLYYNGATNIVTFQTAMYATEGSEPVLELMQGTPELNGEGALSCDTLLLVFQQGDVKKSEVKYPWKSFRLPEYTENTPVVLKIKAVNISGFNVSNPRGTDYYIYKMNF